MMRGEGMMPEQVRAPERKEESPVEALKKREAGLIERLGGKSKEIARLLAFATAMTAGGAEAARPGQKPEAPMTAKDALHDASDALLADMAAHQDLWPDQTVEAAKQTLAERKDGPDGAAIDIPEDLPPKEQLEKLADYYYAQVPHWTVASIVRNPVGRKEQAVQAADLAMARFRKGIEGSVGFSQEARDEAMRLLYDGAGPMKLAALADNGSPAERRAAELLATLFPHASEAK